MTYFSAEMEWEASESRMEWEMENFEASATVFDDNLSEFDDSDEIWPVQDDCRVWFSEDRSSLHPILKPTSINLRVDFSNSTGSFHSKVAAPSPEHQDPQHTSPSDRLDFMSQINLLLERWDTREAQQRERDRLRKQESEIVAAKLKQQQRPWREEQERLEQDGIVCYVRDLFVVGSYNNGYHRFLNGLSELFADDKAQRGKESVSSMVARSNGMTERSEMISTKQWMPCSGLGSGNAYCVLGEMPQRMEVCTRSFSFDYHELALPCLGLLRWPTGIGTLGSILYNFVGGKILELKSNESTVEPKLAVAYVSAYLDMVGIHDKALDAGFEEVLDEHFSNPISCSSDAFGKIDNEHVDESTNPNVAEKYNVGWYLGSLHNREDAVNILANRPLRWVRNKIFTSIALSPQLASMVRVLTRSLTFIEDEWAYSGNCGAIVHDLKSKQEYNIEFIYVELQGYHTWGHDPNAKDLLHDQALPCSGVGKWPTGIGTFVGNVYPNNETEVWDVFAVNKGSLLLINEIGSCKWNGIRSGWHGAPDFIWTWRTSCNAQQSIIEDDINGLRSSHSKQRQGVHIHNEAMWWNAKFQHEGTSWYIGDVKIVSSGLIIVSFKMKMKNVDKRRIKRVTPKVEVESVNSIQLSGYNQNLFRGGYSHHKIEARIVNQKHCSITQVKLPVSTSIDMLEDKHVVLGKVTLQA